MHTGHLRLERVYTDVLVNGEILIDFVYVRSVCK